WNAFATNPFDGRARIWLDVPDIIFGAERAHPAIKHLNSPSTSADLEASKPAQHVNQFAHETAPHSLVAKHELFCFKKGLRSATFYHVAGESERRTHETDNRNSAGEGAGNQRDRLADITEIVCSAGGQRIDVFRFGNRIFDRRTFAGEKLQVQTHRLNRQKEVGKNNCSVHVKDLDWL